MGKVRRSGRIAKEIRILLLGTDWTGKVFSEETHTVTLSRHGAGIVSKHKLAPDGLATMRFLGGTTETTIRLVGQLGQDERGYVYGVAFVDEEEDFWQLQFPPPSQWNVKLDGPMQCDSCKRCEVIDQSEIEADVFALSESILRYCIYCGRPTMWRRPSQTVANPSALAVKETTATQRADELERSLSRGRLRSGGTELLVSEPLSPPPLSPTALAAVAKAKNRRKDIRTRVNFSACVRYQNCEEIVECVNLSKRGFAFRSRKLYPVGGYIEVAVPVFVGTRPSFVTGSVRHATALPNQNFQYGVMYMRGPFGASEIEHDRRDYEF